MRADWSQGHRLTLAGQLRAQDVGLKFGGSESGAELVPLDQDGAEPRQQPGHENGEKAEATHPPHRGDAVRSRQPR